MTMSSIGYVQAIEDFHRARRQAALEEALNRLRGRPDHLLSYEEIRRQVGAHNKIERGLEEIPLDAIVGSVGRYADFTRTFLPRSDSMQDRWARVKALATGDGGWPPIEVYKLGDAYFVLDGNHRVSVARQMGLQTIPAYVTEVQSKVTLTPDTDPEELVCQVAHADFLEETSLRESRPEADLRATVPGAYQTLHEHIQVHRYYMGLEQKRDISYEEASAHWYDTVFWPVVSVIRDRGLLREFPSRTETDLYLWLSEHRAQLEDALGWDIQPETAAADMAAKESGRREPILNRVGGRLLEAFRPSEFEPGPPPGTWRTQRFESRPGDRIFNELLVAINGEESGWRALEQALIIAGREDSSVRGLHVVPSPADIDTEATREIRARFAWRMGEVGLSGKLVIEAGQVNSRLCDRARWNDLLVMPLSYPPSARGLERLGSGFRQVVHHCSRPILAVSETVTQLGRPLLAYDGSAKAEEALFMTTYLSARWRLTPVVLFVANGKEPDAVLDRARTYLAESGVEGEFVVKQPSVAAAILAAADQYGCDTIIMGGYGTRPVLEIVMGSVLNDVLRTAHKPILICR